LYIGIGRCARYGYIPDDWSSCVPRDYYYYYYYYVPLLQKVGGLVLLSTL